jgi:hypothetical protein
MCIFERTKPISDLFACISKNDEAKFPVLGGAMGDVDFGLGRGGETEA